MTETTVNLPRLLTPAQAAEYLQVKESTLADWRYRRIGPAFVRAGGVRYEASELQRWIAQQKHSTEADSN